MDGHPVHIEASDWPKRSALSVYVLNLDTQHHNVTILQDMMLFKEDFVFVVPVCVYT